MATDSRIREVTLTPVRTHSFDLRVAVRLRLRELSPDVTSAAATASETRAALI